MAQDKLRYRAEMDTKNFDAGVSNIQKGLNKSTKSVRKQGQAFTQLAYALDDAQYGFRGVQNNIQAIAVTAGASGPLVLGITAATVAIGYLIEKTDLFGASADKLKKRVKTLNEEIKALQTSIFGGDADSVKLLSKWDDRIKKQEEILKNLTSKKAVQSGELVTVGSKAQIEAAELQLSILKAARATDELRINQIKKKDDAAKKYKKTLADIKKTEDIAEFAPETGLAVDDSGINLESVFGETQNLFGLSELPHVIEDSTDALADLESALRQSGSALAGLSVKNSEAVMKAKEDFGTLKEQIEQNFGNALVNAFGAAATAGDNFLGVLGKGLLSALGTMMISVGTAAVISGKARVAAGDVTGAAAIKTGYASIAGGVILKAGGSLIGGKAKSGGGGSGSGSGGAAARPSVTPSRIQGFGDSGQLVASVRGQEIRFLLQGANDSYNARN